MSDALKTKTVKVLFCPVLLDLQKKHCFSEGSQASLICLSGKSNT